MKAKVTPRMTELHPHRGNYSQTVAGQKDGGRGQGLFQGDKVHSTTNLSGQLDGDLD